MLARRFFPRSRFRQPRSIPGQLDTQMDYTLYFIVIAAIWFCVWSTLVWLLETRRTRGPLLRRLNPTQRIALVFGVLSTPVVYALGYAPFLAFLNALPAYGASVSPLDDLFVPVQWLIDNTSFQQSFIAWADVWGIDSDSVLSATRSRIRNGFWGDTNPWVYALFWVTSGSLCTFLPPYVFHRGLSLARNLLASSPTAPTTSS